MFENERNSETLKAFPLFLWNRNTWQQMKS